MNEPNKALQGRQLSPQEMHSVYWKLVTSLLPNLSHVYRRIKKLRTDIGREKAAVGIDHVPDFRKIFSDFIEIVAETTKLPKEDLVSYFKESMKEFLRKVMNPAQLEDARRNEIAFIDGQIFISQDYLVTATNAYRDYMKKIHATDASNTDKKEPGSDIDRILTKIDAFKEAIKAVTVYSAGKISCSEEELISTRYYMLTEMIDNL